MIFNRYILFLLGGVFLFSLSYVLLFNALVWAGLDVQKMPYETLYNYQLEKAQHSEARIIFVGDSALGNAVNAQLYTKLSGLKTENYALTGKFGYRGSFEMLKSVHAQNKELETVVVMQTLDMMKREVAQEYKPSVLIAGLDFSVFNLSALKLLMQAIQSGAWNTGKKDQMIVDDYIPQNTLRRPKVEEKAFLEKEIKISKLTFLRKIAAYCRAHHLECLYAHAPLAEPRCRNSGGYVEAVNILIRQTGLEIAVEESLCLSDGQVGDSSDHVHPDYKDDFTRAYFKNLAILPAIDKP